MVLDVTVRYVCDLTRRGVFRLGLRVYVLCLFVVFIVAFVLVGVLGFCVYGLC